jgi:hypothetical protein
MGHRVKREGRLGETGETRSEIREGQRTEFLIADFGFEI